MVFSFGFLIELFHLDAANRRSGFTVARVRYGLHPRQPARRPQDARDEAPVSANKGSRGATNRRGSYGKGTKSPLRVDFSKRLCRILRLSNESLAPSPRRGQCVLAFVRLGRNGVRGGVPKH